MKNNTSNKKNRTRETKSFRSKRIPLPDTIKLAREASEWLLNYDDIDHVNINLSIAGGNTKQITVHCDRKGIPTKRKYIIDVINVLPKKYFSFIIKYFSFPNPDRYINEWQDDHPEYEVVNTRVVYVNTATSEVWIVAKTNVD